MKKTFPILALVLVLVLAFAPCVAAYTPVEMTQSVTGWLIKNITVEQAENEIDSYLDQTVFATARSGNSSYAKAYVSYINTAVSEHFAQLYLNDYARISLAAMSVNLNPKNIGGHNLLQAIVDTDLSNEAYTGGVAYALLALNSAGFSPEKQAAAKTLLLSAQRTDGGFNAYITASPTEYWTLGGESDSTGIVLQALAPYKSEKDVAQAIERAVKFLEGIQMSDGGFGSFGSGSAESTSQVLAALCELGIDPLGDEFVKDGKTILTALSQYINPDGGARCWDGSSNIMTGYQMLLGINAYDRFASGGAGLFEMSSPVVICYSINNSFFGRSLPWLAGVLCKIVTQFYAMTGIESYR